MPDSHPRFSDRAAFAAQQWRAERPDLDPFPMEVLGRLAEVTHILARDHLQPLFARYNLQGGEFDVLATLRRSGPPFALTPTALYEATMVSSGGMSNRLDRLEKSGLIERQKHPTDRRGTLVVLTRRAIELLDELIPLHIQNEKGVLARLTSEEQHLLNRLLRKLQGGNE